MLHGHWFDYHWGPMWWVSMWGIEWVIEEENENVTLFCCKALPRCCALWSPILLPLRFNVASVYIKYWVSNRRRKWECYFVLLQSSSKTLYSLVINSIATEVECVEYLYEEAKEVKWSKDRWINIITKLRCVAVCQTVTSHKVVFLFYFHTF